MASTSQGHQEVDRHGWNSLESYRSIHENRLNNHSFLDPDRPHTVAFNYYDVEGGLVVQVVGEIYCLGNYLRRRGFPSDVVHRTVERLWQERRLDFDESL